MSCGGCSGAIDRVLKKTEGVCFSRRTRRPVLMDPHHPTLLAGIASYEISIERQEVVVHTSMDYNTVLATLKKTGKEVKSGEVVTPSAA